MPTSGLSVTQRVDTAIPTPVNADLSAKQYFGVTLADLTNGQCKLMDDVTDIPFGLLMDKPAAAGREGMILRQGRAPGIAAEVLAQNDLVRIDNAGKCAVFVAGTDVTTWGVGIVIKGAATGFYAEIEFNFTSLISGATHD